MAVEAIIWETSEVKAVDATNGAAKTTTNGTVNGTEAGDDAAESTTKEAVNDDEEAKPAKILAPEGSLNSFTSLYQGPKDENEIWTWLDKEPEHVPDAAENDETAQHALITRLQKAEDSRKKYEIHSIIVQSPQLKTVLAEILKGYPGVHCGLNRLVFEAPFKPFVHRWAGILAYRERKDLDEKTAEHLEILYKVLKDELKDVLKTFEDYIQHGIVTYEHLWAIFQPGDVIYSNSQLGAPSAFIFNSGQYVKTQCGMAYRLSAKAVDWDGTSFGSRSENILIFEYMGTAKITGLKAFPLSFHPEKEELHKSLVERGQKFEKLAGAHYREYKGFAVSWDEEGNEIPYHCTGRVIVDASTFRRFSTRYGPFLDAFDFNEGASTPESKYTTPEDGGYYIVGDTKSVQLDQEYEFGKQTEDNRQRLTPTHHLLCCPRVRGYSLKKKEWLEFYLDRIGDITFNTNAFDSLVLPDDQKELILSFAESQAMNQSAFDDVISGKGRGHITLLSGPPGVGKTLTAESVAEHMHAPLYMMSAGDLGINPDQVEHRLSNILDMIAKWNAVLLLDECDVFLEKRSAHDLERNKLVSIFLRVLEYYEGILFLTTNRIDNIDAAFQSRIHASLEYPDLDNKARRVIWENFLGLLEGGVQWSEKDLRELSSVQLNGRQIKNVLKSAALLSARKREPLSRKYVDVVLAIEKRRPGVAEGFN